MRFDDKFLENAISNGASIQREFSNALTLPSKEKKRSHKYNASPTERDGIRFDSKTEAIRYDNLKQQQGLGIITELDPRPDPYELQPAFTWRGRKFQPITYTPDFLYMVDGVQVIEDWKKRDSKTGKPFLTAEFRRTQKMFLYRYPEINFWVNCDPHAIWKKNET